MKRGTPISLLVLIAVNLVLTILVEFAFVYTVPRADATAVMGYGDSTVVSALEYPGKGYVALVQTPEGERHSVLLDRHGLFGRYRLVHSGTGPVEDGEDRTVMASLFRLYRLRVTGDQIRANPTGVQGYKDVIAHYGIWCIGLIIVEALLYDTMRKIFRK